MAEAVTKKNRPQEILQSLIHRLNKNCPFVIFLISVFSHHCFCFYIVLFNFKGAEKKRRKEQFFSLKYFSDAFYIWVFFIDYLDLQGTSLFLTLYTSSILTALTLHRTLFAL